MPEQPVGSHIVMSVTQQRQWREARLQSALNLERFKHGVSADRLAAWVRWPTDSVIAVLQRLIEEEKVELGPEGYWWTGK